MRRRGGGCPREVPALHPRTQEEQEEGGWEREGGRGFPRRRRVVRRRVRRFGGKKLFLRFFSLLLYFQPQRRASFSEARALFGLLKVFDNLKSLKVFFDNFFI